MTLLLLGIVAFAGLVHAGFQLSVGALTLMSSHALGRNTRHARILRMMWAHAVGCGIFTAMLLASTVLAVQLWLPSSLFLIAWVLVSGGIIGLGVAVWAVYYRAGPGTTLWVPHGLATYITKRAGATKSSTEAFSLGMSTVVLELLFIMGPLLAASLLLADSSPAVITTGIALYSLVSILGIAIVACFVGSGHSVSDLQKWRTQNKRFLQFVSGAGLIVLGGYLYAEKVIGGIGL